MTVNKRRLLIGGLIATAALTGMILWYGAPSRHIDRKIDAARIQLEMVSDALHNYEKRNNRFPTAQEGLDVLVRDNYFLPNGLIDPWGEKVKYSCDSKECSSVRIWSKGMDKRDNDGHEDDVVMQVHR